MFSYWWPMALVVLANVLYQICAKAMPSGMHPLAAVTVTYVVSAITAVIVYYLTNPEGNLFREYESLNLSPAVFGVVIVGLEAGWIYAYKAGWPVSTAFIVQSALLAAILLAVGYVLYHEVISWHKIVGVLICLIGLAFLNYNKV